MNKKMHWASHLGSVALATTLLALPALSQAQNEKPQYGGTLNIGMVYLTLSPLSWDPGDWAWKFGQDTGPKIGRAHV